MGVNYLRTIYIRQIAIYKKYKQVLLTYLGLGFYLFIFLKKYIYNKNKKITLKICCLHLL